MEVFARVTQNDITLNKIIYPKNTKHYNFSRIPMKGTPFLRMVERLVIPFLLGKVKRSVTDINMDKLDKKSQYVTLCNHHQFYDFAVAIKASMPKTFHYTMSIEAFKILPMWMLLWGGVIGKRKFNQDPSIVKLYIKLARMGRNVGIFPEARYTVTGQLSVLPDATGKIIKSLGLPLVIYLFHGHHMLNPIWGNQKPRKVPVNLERKYVLSKEEVLTLPVEKINEIIRREMWYDEYEYILKNNYLINEPYRAEGLHKILYKCPHCKKDFYMISSGTNIKCDFCKVEYHLRPDMSLECINGNTIYHKVTDWLDFERKSVRQELTEGNYYYEETLPAVSFPHPKNYFELGDVKVIHNLNGFDVKGVFRGKDFHFIWKPAQNYSLQIEHSSPTFKKKDCFALSTFDDTLFFFPKNSQTILKLYFAVEELYDLQKK